jgi:excisionase family DNA binding protein
MELKTYTVPEVAAILKVEPKFLYAKARSGEINCLHIGRCVRITEAQLQEYLEKVTVTHDKEG